MIVEASVTGLIKTGLMVVGAIVLLRFIGQIMEGKRNLEEERRSKAEKDKYEKAQKKSKLNFGKISILKDTSKKSTSSTIEDVDYEEIV